MHIGRPGHEKNRARAVSILASMVASGVDAVLVFVGRTMPEENLQLAALASREHVSDRVHVVGESDHVPRLLASADLTILTSTREGLPGVVLESCAAGTPVLASALPGVRWLADTFPGVVPVSLNQADAAWATAAGTCLEMPRGASARRQALLEFEGSQFHITCAAQRFLELWTRP